MIHYVYTYNALGLATEGMKGEWQTDLLFYVNGKRTALSNVSPEMTVLQYLRASGLTGTKLGCGEVCMYDSYVRE